MIKLLGVRIQMNAINYIFLVLGLLFIIQGIIIWKKQMVTLTLDFNSKNVKKEDVKQYTMSFGIAYIIIGIAVLLTMMSKVIISRFQDAGYILSFVMLISAIVIIIKTQVRYKTGLFR